MSRESVLDDENNDLLFSQEFMGSYGTMGVIERPQKFQPFVQPFEKNYTTPSTTPSLLLNKLDKRDMLIRVNYNGCDDDDNDSHNVIFNKNIIYIDIYIFHNL